MAFAVDKWYLDLVTGDGVAVIGYVVAVRWLGLDVRLASRLHVGPAGARGERTALGDTAVPTAADGLVRWASPALGVHGTWQALDAAFDATLLTSADGSIEWACVIPRARANVTIDGTRYEGLGYVERLRLTVAPWALPFHVLRWGRHLSDRHAVVWIEWDGAQPRRTTWLDGVLQPAAQVTASGVDGLSGGHALRWHDGHDLVQRRVGPALAAVAPMLGAAVAGRLAAMHEHKQCSPSALVDAMGRPLDAGWAIHEVVTW